MFWASGCTGKHRIYDLQRMKERSEWLTCGLTNSSPAEEFYMNPALVDFSFSLFFCLLLLVLLFLFLYFVTKKKRIKEKWVSRVMEAILLTVVK